ncbi:MAG: amidase [Acidobacteria bacterium]|nr:amidase [Acidobacteriota bacterium]
MRACHFSRRLRQRRFQKNGVNSGVPRATLSRRFLLFLGCGVAVVLLGTLLASEAAAQNREFLLEDATIESINAAFDSGALTSEKLMSLYMARIAAYEDQGPNINAFVNIHPDPLSIARALDEERRTKGPRSPLHGIPVVLKDTYNTSDIPTTGASRALKEFRPPNEATVVERLRAAGAIILGKTNMTEMVTAALDSSLGGRTSNPWDLTRTPGQSSAGTGAALAANFVLLGTGTDNGQSVRSPASAGGLVGLKPTIGLVSCAGVMPSSLSHNSCGPLARSVADLAKLLDVMAGFDPKDFMTRLALGQIPKTYTAFLDAEALQGARFGVVVELMGNKPENAEVNRVFDEAMKQLESLGATVVPVRIPNMQSYAGVGSDIYESWDLWNKWWADLGPTAPYRNMADFLDRAKGQYDPAIEPRLRERQAHSGPQHFEAYQQSLLKMHEFRKLLVSVMDKESLDAMVYPMQQILVAEHGRSNSGRNGFLASMGMLPAIDVPAGYSNPLPTAPDGVPIGMDFLGRPFDEGRLIKLGYAWEKKGFKRKWPSKTPPLAGETIKY